MVVRELAAALLPDTDAPPDGLEAMLPPLVRAAREQANRLRDLTDQLARRGPSRDDARARLAAAEADLAELMTRAGADDEAALLEVIERGRRRRELERDHDAAARSLDDLLGVGAERQEAEARLTELGEAELEARAAALDAELAELDARRDACLSERQALTADLARLTSRDDVTRLSEERERLRAELVEHAEEYAAHQLALALLDRETERFARENQPRLLRSTGALLDTITDGRHRAVQRSLGGNELVVVGADGVERTPDKLSTGTREQVFLAIRLAYAVDWCERAEPLPLVMDDVLVNFDQDRQLATLRALASVAGHTQVLFLTCHRHLAELASALPEVAVHRLPGPAAP